MKHKSGIVIQKRIGSKYDSKKIVLEFSSMNVHKKKCNSGDYKNKWCFYGIKLKHSENDE